MTVGESGRALGWRGSQVKVVRSVDRKDKDKYLQETEEGERGYLVTRGRNLMSGYVHNEEATKLYVRCLTHCDGSRHTC